MTLHRISHALKTGLLAVSALAATATAASAAATLTAAPATQIVRFSIYLPLQNRAAMKALLTAVQTKGSPSYHKWLTPAQFNAQFGPSAATIAQAKASLSAAGLKVGAVNGRAIQVSGTVAQVNSALKLSLRSQTTDTGKRIIALTPAVLPGGLTALGAVTPAFAPTPALRTHSATMAAAIPASRRGPYGGYYYNDLKEAYDYPSYATILPGGNRLDGSGVSVAIVMADDALDSDVAAMFAHENFTGTTGQQPPTINHVYVDCDSTLAPGTTDPTTGVAACGYFGGPATSEASLDVQQVLGGAPGASVTLLSLPDLSDSYITDAYYAAVVTNAFDIVSSSFGGCENIYTANYQNGFDFTYLLGLNDDIFAQGNLEGITFIASSGDNGGLGCPNPLFFAIGATGGYFVKGVENPADDPNVTAVGGGNLKTSSTGTYVTGTSMIPKPSTYVSENANGDPEVPYSPWGSSFGPASGGWWGAGGGISQAFAQPPYQTAGITGATARTVPDVGMLVGGCPGGLALPTCDVAERSYVITWVGGGPTGVIGTSVAAPEFAGALALAVEANGRYGNLNYVLYSQGAAQTAAGLSAAPADKQFYHMKISGFDGAYYTSPTTGYNYITGNGTPDVRKLFGLTAYAPAGDPQTPSNP